VRFWMFPFSSFAPFGAAPATLDTSLGLASVFSTTGHKKDPLQRPVGLNSTLRLNLFWWWLYRTCSGAKMSDEVDALRDEVSRLRAQMNEIYDAEIESFHFPPAAQKDWSEVDSIPARGNSAATLQALIENAHSLDFDPRVNTSSYVNVSFEPEEEAVALLGLRVNLADQTVYPQSYKLYDRVVAMLARLWHCPEPSDFPETQIFAGAGTVGSTEACLLAGLALKFRWREWRAERDGLSDAEVLGTKPNIVISTCYQAAWEKLFKYMDIKPRLVEPSVDTFKVDPEQVRGATDENTVGRCGVHHGQPLRRPIRPSLGCRPGGLGNKRSKGIPGGHPCRCCIRRIHRAVPARPTRLGLPSRRCPLDIEQRS
jgi:hypothetical protein